MGVRRRPKRVKRGSKESQRRIQGESGEGPKRVRRGSRERVRRVSKES